MDTEARDPKEKFLITGDVKGKLSVLYKKVDDIQKKCGLFDLLICVGDFFGESCPEWTFYKNKQLQAPITTYILGPVKKIQQFYYTSTEGCEIAQNISFLGPYGVLTSAKGSRIAYLSGVEKDSDLNFSTENVLKLKELCRKGQPIYHGVDMLISNQWPEDITQLDGNAEYTPKESSGLLSWLCSEIMPRYHFAGFEDVSYERPPFSHLNNYQDKVVATRFIGLANVGNQEKKRWIYALSLKPLKFLSNSEISARSHEQTQLPFRNLDKIRNSFEKSGQFFFQIDNKKRECHSNQKPSKRFKMHNNEKSSGCWFCLSEPNIEKHLIISVGKHSYLALAKGGLVKDHIIICSIGHYSSMSVLPETERREIGHYKEVLKTFFSNFKKVAVFYERNFKTFHLQIQVIPLPLQLASKIKSAYLEAAEVQNIKFDEYGKGTQSYLLKKKEEQYFHIELSDGTELLHSISGSFPLHFGRDALVQKKVLNMNDKGDWRKCLATKEEETVFVEKLKKKFAVFDFTIDKDK